MDRHRLLQAVFYWEEKLKRYLILALLLVAGVACTQTLTYTDAATLSWSAVTTLEDSSPIPPGDVVEYEVGRSVYPVANRMLPETVEGLTAALSMAISVPNDGQSYAYAVRTKRTTDGGSTILVSAWNWSDINGAATPNPFLYRHQAVVLPSIPLGFQGN
jgi:hypothetical protein